MINQKTFLELPYEEKISTLQEIFKQIQNPSENLQNIKYYLETDFPFQESSLIWLFNLVSNVSLTGKEIDEGLSHLYTNMVKVESDGQQNLDDAQADELISTI